MPTPGQLAGFARKGLGFLGNALDETILPGFSAAGNALNSLASFTPPAPPVGPTNPQVNNPVIPPPTPDIPDTAPNVTFATPPPPDTVFPNSQAEMAAGRILPTAPPPPESALPSDVDQLLHEGPTQYLAQIATPPLMAAAALTGPGAVLDAPLATLGGAALFGGAGLARQGVANALPDTGVGGAAQTILRDPLAGMAIDTAGGAAAGAGINALRDVGPGYVSDVWDALTKPGKIPLVVGEASPTARLLPIGDGGVLDRIAADKAARLAQVGADTEAGQAIVNEQPDRPTMLAAIQQAVQKEIAATGSLSPESQAALKDGLTPDELVGMLGQSLGAQPTDEVMAAQNADKAAQAAAAKAYNNSLNGAAQPEAAAEAVPPEAQPVPPATAPGVAAAAAPVTPPSGTFWDGIPSEAGATAVPMMPPEALEGAPIQETPGALPNSARKPFVGSGGNIPPDTGAIAPTMLPPAALEGAPIQANPGALPDSAKIPFVGSGGTIPPDSGATAPPLPGMGGGNPPTPPPTAAGDKNAWQRFLAEPLTTLNQTAKSFVFGLDNTMGGRLMDTAGVHNLQNHIEATAGAYQRAITGDNLPDFLAAKQAEITSEYPELAQNGWTVSKMQTAPKNGGFGLVGPGVNPDTGLPNVGGGAIGVLGQLPGAAGEEARNRLNFLATYQQIYGPKTLADDIMSGIQSGKFTWQDLQMNPQLRQSLGRGVNLVMGHSSLRMPTEVNIAFQTPNWIASQVELTGRALVDRSITGDVARNTLGKLAALGTAATISVNLANGVSPTDPRAWRNGVPMIVITPAMSKNMQNVPVAGHVLRFKPNTQLDAYGPVGELMSSMAGIGRAGVAGATAPGTAQTKAVKGTGGVLGEAGYYAGTHASALTNMVRAIMTGKIPYSSGKFNITADPFGSLGRLAEMNAPIGTDALTGNSTQTAGVTAGSLAGLRFHQPSAPVKGAALPGVIGTATRKALPGVLPAGSTKTLPGVLNTKSKTNKPPGVP